MNGAGIRNKKVCVDLSCWLVQFCSANRSPAFLRDKVYLKNLFHRIRALLALNCSLIFVSGFFFFHFFLDPKGNGNA
jgi:flap endonuclease GEN